MCELTAISERRACRLAGLSRDAFRHEPVPTPATQALSARLIELAQVRRRFGYRRLHDLLKPEYPSVNHKKVYRLYQEAKLSVRRRRKAKRPVGERQKLLAASAPNHTWSMDFVFDALANGRRIKSLTVVDDFTRESVDIAVDHGISGKYVVRLLDQAACFRGYPRAVRTDNGPEFTSRAFIAWTQQHGIEHILIEPGCPTQNVTSKASTASSATNASTSIGSRRSPKLAMSSPTGGVTTTKYARTAAAGASRHRSSPPTTAHSKPTTQ